MEAINGKYWGSFMVVVIFLVSSSVSVRSAAAEGGGDAAALLSLKLSIDPLGSLPWTGSDACSWQGVRECMKGRVTKLVVEYQNLSGNLDPDSLNRLDQLRVLSLKGNSLTGQIPDLSGLLNLKSLYFSWNNFSGNFPLSLTGLHRLKVIDLAHNQISGPITHSLLRLPRLYAFYLQDNRFNGSFPPLNQSSLRFLNVSNNQLSGPIPSTPTLLRFNTSSFGSNTVGLCGEQIQKPCYGIAPTGSSPSSSPKASSSNSKRRHSKKALIIGGSVGGSVLALFLVIVLAVVCKRRRGSLAGEGRRKNKGIEETGIGGEGGRSREEGGASAGGSGMEGNNGERQGGFSWEGQGQLGSLVFLGAGDQQMRYSYSLEDLLKASAETLGRGTVGSTYKAVMESGFIVTVKRLKDARYPRLEEFKRHMEVLGSLSHPNLVPLRAYFQAKEERLLVYEYFPNGSLFSLLHGARASGGGKPLHWTSCLKISEDLATGLLYIHQNPGLTHGNLKSSNVLLGPEFESCITDYGLTVFLDPESQEETSATSLFYKAPESRGMRIRCTQQADVYSFGVLLLELLTGKTPVQDLVQEHGSDIPRWVHSVREEETESGDDPASGNEAAEEKLQALVNIAMACVAITPETRPSMRDVLKMIRDARAEVQVSSNSSDHSPGRWSDTVQSLPREEHLSI